jgi:cysteine desulfurase
MNVTFTIIIIIVILIFILLFWFKKTNKASLNNNATTQLPQNVKDAMNKYSNYANIHTTSVKAQLGQKIVADFKNYLLHYSFPDLSAPEYGDYKVIITSGATESNNFIIRAFAQSYPNLHIITSQIEHDSILDCIKDANINATLIGVDAFGNFNQDDILNSIQPNTKLVSLMKAQNEIGNIYPIEEYAKQIKLINPNIVVHSDITQYFGKCLSLSHMMDVDAFSISFHKLHCPQGIGVLIIKQNVLSNLKAQISGNQQMGYRGGTQPIGLIAGTIEGMEYNFKKREQKNTHMQKLKNYLISKLNNPSIQLYTDPNLKFVFLGKEPQSPNTCMFSIIGIDGFCIKKLFKRFNEQNIEVSSGSACSTGKLSHVLKAMGLEEFAKTAIRVSFCDENTFGEIDYFVKMLLKNIKEQKK